MDTTEYREAVSLESVLSTATADSRHSGISPVREEMTITGKLREDVLPVKSENIHSQTVSERFEEYITADDLRPLFFLGDALELLRQLPSRSVDCAITSPPYWRKRQYAEKGIGLEADYKDYITVLCAIFFELKRVLKDTGSFWLSIGDSYIGNLP